MTPPQPEYIITERQIQALRLHLPFDIIDSLCSRPAPAAQEPLASKAYQAGIECGREEAAIDAATIRNQTLDEAITECEWDHPITQEDVWRKLESLRHTEAQQ